MSTPTYMRVSDKWVHVFLEHFQGKNADYTAVGIENHVVLGPPGQFADIWRKVLKLYKALWLGQRLGGEGVREVLLDLIGHCFLTLDMLEQTDDGDSRPLPWPGPPGRANWRDGTDLR